MRTLKDLMIINENEYMSILLDALIAHVSYLRDLKGLNERDQDLMGDTAKSLALLSDAKDLIGKHLAILNETKAGLNLLWCETANFLQFLSHIALIQQIEIDIAEIESAEKAIDSILLLHGLIGKIKKGNETACGQCPKCLAKAEAESTNAVKH